MATSRVILSDAFVAGADLSTKQYTLVKFNGSDQLVAAAAITDEAFILMDNPKQGVSGTVALVGIEKVILGGTVASGNKLSSDASGHAIVAATGSHVIGQALASGVAGDLIPVRVGVGGVV